MKPTKAASSVSTMLTGTNNQIPRASLPIRAGALFSCRRLKRPRLAAGMKPTKAASSVSTMLTGTNNQIPRASLPIRAGALFSCRLSSFGKSTGLHRKPTFQSLATTLACISQRCCFYIRQLPALRLNRLWQVQTLQTVPRSGQCVPRPRPNTDREQCTKTVVTQPERSFHHEA